MTVPEWLAQAQADAKRRGLPALAPILEGLARATTVLRAADWNESAISFESGRESVRGSQGDRRG